MPECVRCGDFTDNPSDGEYHYCDECLDYFAAVEERGVIIEHESDGDVHVIVTANNESFDGGSEQSQIDGLARGKHIAEQTGLPAIFKYKATGSCWELDEYLQAHPKIRQNVHERLRRVPDNTAERLIDRIKSLL